MSALLRRLIDDLRCLPGVGPKSAQRMAYQLLERDRDGGRRLAATLAEAMTGIGHCRRCRDYSENELCAICLGGNRDQQLLCIVESPIDLAAIEQATGYRGNYFVMHGRLSAIDGRGPRELGLDLLANRLLEEGVQELIIATNATVEGEATAHYLAELARSADVRATRLAHGVPLGGELEFVDRGTLALAFGSRQSL
ncbi:recombination mediator RecR [Pseudofulvimonas gallinarii]|jgi:recombination protein RecR|uniref:Recombination protein RecR n=1 Tax=Pseudofulvimonas gallinarii TaxID=634155 RepID=A0A4S3L088_9GAMM|nr:recombination mediator RecR [Pseudofulvimonas gallinarii]TCT01288.1 DNA replication and repair protein RecR [Pseudofulvimonas gallinarii]THD15050.1 recombination protein RecR [Pseudofulvimonas gallinarii]